MKLPTGTIAGVPSWHVIAFAAVVVLAFVTFHRHKGTATAPQHPNSYVVVRTPQNVTPYNVPVTRGGRTASRLH